MIDAPLRLLLVRLFCSFCIVVLISALAAWFVPNSLKLAVLIVTAVALLGALSALRKVVIIGGRESIGNVIAVHKRTTVVALGAAAICTLLNYVRESFTLQAIACAGVAISVITSLFLLGVVLPLKSHAKGG